ncbi:MAG TPA: c-type cytochrome [Gallionella sp.]|nr:c-type cytochrome [Gallionella sp.]
MRSTTNFTKPLLATLFAVALATPCFAEQSAVDANTKPVKTERVWNEMNKEKQEALGLKGNPLLGSFGFEICQDCHRSDASGRVNGATPRLAGQHTTVLIKQMTDILNGIRDNPKMTLVIADHTLLPRDIADIAAYLQSLPTPADIGKGPGTALARGKEVYDKDCASCHGDKGEGNAEKFYPMVASQHYKYLLREMVYMRNETRRNANPKMVKAVKAYSEADLEAAADYMSRLVVPSK